MSPLMDLFDKEKGVLSKAEKRLAQADKDKEGKGEERAAASYEKLFNYLEENRDIIDRHRADFSSLYTRLAGRLTEHGKDAEAVRAYDRALGLDESNFDALNGKGTFLLERDAAEGALGMYDRALVLEPRHAITRYNRVRALKALDRKDEALASMRALVDDEPKNLEYLEALIAMAGTEVALMRRKALLHRERNESELARLAVEDALSTAPKDKELWALAADLAGDRGDDKGQVGALEHALEAGGSDAGLLRRLGRLHMRLGEHSRALHAFDRGLDVAAEDATLLRGRGDALVALGRVSEADWAYSAAVRASGEDVEKELLLSAARVKTERGESEAAKELLVRARGLDPDDVEVMRAHADALAAAGDHAGALEQLERALRRDSDDVELWARTVEVLKHLGDDDRLVKCARRVVALDKGRRDTWVVLGDALARLAKHADAVKAYDEALGLRADDALTMAKRLEAIVAQEDWEAAEAAAADLLEVEREHGRALTVRAEALERLGRHEEAIRAADAVLKSSPRDVESHVRKGRCHKATGDLAKAAESLLQAVKMDKSREDAKRLLVEVYATAGRNDEAVGVIDGLLVEVPNDAGLWEAKGRAHLDTGTLELARRSFSRALELRGEDAGLLALLSRALAGLGDLQGASAALEKATRLAPDDADVQILAGKTFVAQGKHELAEKAFGLALKVRPRDMEAMILREQSLVALRSRHEDVVDACKSILDAHPKNVQVLVDMGDSLTALARLDEALDAYRKAQDLEPTSVDIARLVARTLRSLGRTEEQLKALDRLLELDATDAPSWTERGTLLKSMRRPEEALRCFEEVTTLNPDDPAAHNNRGVALADLGRFDDAAVAYAKAIELDPNHVGAMRNLGVAFMHMERLPESIGALDMAISIDPKHAPTWNDKGLSLSKQGKLKEALDCFDRGIGLDPQDGAIRNNKGTVLARMGKLPEAIESYKKAVEINPGDKSAWFNMGICHDKLKATDAALEALRHVTEMDPADMAAWKNMGRVMLGASRFEQAVAALDHAVELDPKDNELWNNRGIALDHLERWEEAISNYAKALELQPRDKVAWYNKGVALFQLQRYEESVDAFNTAIEVDAEYHAAKEKREEALDFIRNRDTERYARDILAFEYKHRRAPTKEEAFRDEHVPFEVVDGVFQYISKKESFKLEDLKPQEVADYERASANVIQFCLAYRPHTDDVTVTLAELLFHFPDTSVPRAKRILEYMRQVDKLKLEAERPLRPEMEKAVRAALELPPDERTVADISRRLRAGLLTAKKVKAVLDSLAEEAPAGDQRVALESMRRPKRPKPKAAEAGEGGEGAPEAPAAPAAPKQPSRPLVCSVCRTNPPTIRHFDCGEFVCDDCIRQANATRSLTRKETICPKCKMPIVEGSTDAVL